MRRRLARRRRRRGWRRVAVTPVPAWTMRPSVIGLRRRIIARGWRVIAWRRPAVGRRRTVIGHLTAIIITLAPIHGMIAAGVVREAGLMARQDHERRRADRHRR